MKTITSSSSLSISLLLLSCLICLVAAVNFGELQEKINQRNARLQRIVHHRYVPPIGNEDLTPALLAQVMETKERDILASRFKDGERTTTAKIIKYGENADLATEAIVEERQRQSRQRQKISPPALGKVEPHVNVTNSVLKGKYPVYRKHSLVTSNFKTELEAKVKVFLESCKGHCKTIDSNYFEMCRQHLAAHYSEKDPNMSDSLCKLLNDRNIYLEWLISRYQKMNRIRNGVEEEKLGSVDPKFDFFSLKNQQQSSDK